MSNYRLVVTKKSGEELNIEFRGIGDEELDIIGAMGDGLKEYGYPVRLDELVNEWREVR